MFDLEYIEKEYNEIFDADKKIITDNEDKILDFCKILTMITGIQVCNKYGNIYDYIHEVYISALGVLKNGKH